MQPSIYIIQYAAFRMGHQFLPFFYVKSWSNLTPNGSFKICLLWRFQSTPYMLNLMKFWLRYLRLKTIDIFQKLILFHLFHCQLSPIFLHQIQRLGTDFFICSLWGFKSCHWILKLIKKWQKYGRLKARPNFQKDHENMNLLVSQSKVKSNEWSEGFCSESVTLIKLDWMRLMN